MAETYDVKALEHGYLFSSTAIDVSSKLTPEHGVWTVSNITILSALIEEANERLQFTTFAQRVVAENIASIWNTNHKNILEEYTQLKKMTPEERLDLGKIADVEFLGLEMTISIGQHIPTVFKYQTLLPHSQSGAIKLYTAIDLLEKYNDMYHDSDPLDLKKFNNNYDDLARALLTHHDNTKVKIAGLMIQEGLLWGSVNISNWNELTSDQQQAYAFYYYNIGEDQANDYRKEKLDAGEAYTISPEKIEIMQTHLANKDAVQERANPNDVLWFKLRKEIQDGKHNYSDEDEPCFLAGTDIDLWDGTKKAIEEITPDDWVTSYDKDGELVPGRVTRVFQNRSKHILDMFGLMITPGHVTLCGDGPFNGRYVPVIDILRSDGALVRKDGSKVRAGTGVPLGDSGDTYVWAITGVTTEEGTRVRDKGKIRLGTRFITDDGRDICVADLIAAAGGAVTDDGLIQKDGGEKMPFLWTFTEMLPKPEDYILQRSALHLDEIYQAGEWESAQPQVPAPVRGDLGPVQKSPESVLQAAPPNIPLSMRNSPDQPVMTQKQRETLEARRRKAGKPSGTAVH